MALPTPTAQQCKFTAVAGCAKVACPNNSEGINVVDGCTCTAGYSGAVMPTAIKPFYRNDCIAVACPTHSTPNNVLTGIAGGCICDAGYYGAITAATIAPYYTGTCAPAACPAEADGLNIEEGCTCKAGYRGTVEIATVDENKAAACASANDATNCWTSTCAMASCPADGKTEGTNVVDDPGCTCKAGYTGAVTAAVSSVGYTTTCAAVGCPPSLSTGISVAVGDGCECKAPYNYGMSAGDLVAGTSYKIVLRGTTDFTQIGAATNDVGTVFVRNTEILAEADTETGTASGTIVPSTSGDYYTSSCAMDPTTGCGAPIVEGEVNARRLPEGCDDEVSDASLTCMQMCTLSDTGVTTCTELTYLKCVKPAAGYTLDWDSVPVLTTDFIEPTCDLVALQAMMNAQPVTDVNWKQSDVYSQCAYLMKKVSAGGLGGGDAGVQCNIAKSSFSVATKFEGVGECKPEAGFVHPADRFDWVKIYETSKEDATSTGYQCPDGTFSIVGSLHTTTTCCCGTVGQSADCCWGGPRGCPMPAGDSPPATCVAQAAYVDPVGMCTETGTPSVVEDKAACQAVTALADKNTCEAVPKADGSGRACTFTKSVVAATSAKWEQDQTTGSWFAKVHKHKSFWQFVG